MREKREGGGRDKTQDKTRQDTHLDERVRGLADGGVVVHGLDGAALVERNLVVGWDMGEGTGEADGRGCAGKEG